MQSKENRNAILAVIISGVILFGWNYLFPTQTYDTNQVMEKKEMSVEDIKPVSENSNEKKINSVIPNSIEEKVITLKDGNLEFTIDSFLNLQTVNSINSDKLVSEVFKKSDFEILINNSKQKFQLTKINDSTVKISTLNQEITGTVALNSKGYLDIDLNGKSVFVPRLGLKSEEQEMDDGQKFNSFVLYSDGLDTVKVGEEDTEKFEGKFGWFGLDFNYHILSFVLDSNKMYKLQTKGNLLLIEPLEGANSFNYKVSFLKKNYDDLKKFGFNLSKSVDFGIWEIIAVPILRGLQYFYNLLQNYGLSIILLTILIRLLTFPLQYKSFKSMKKMQVIQPELKKIKEKYKDNPQKVQQETMALFKKAGANPLGGCLPMLLQMPVFFAFYKVLFTSVELVDAPFYFWITDLSEKDPFYILPVLMGIAMWLNMKLTPSTTMDPAQQKVMMFMPIMFSLFMLNLPAGLTLYILVSTIVGMLQQLFVYKRTA